MRDPMGILLLGIVIWLLSWVLAALTGLACGALVPSEIRARVVHVASLLLVVMGGTGVFLMIGGAAWIVCRSF